MFNQTYLWDFVCESLVNIFRNCVLLQFFSSSVLQFFSSSVLQFFSSSVLQFFSSLVLQLFNFLSIQLSRWIEYVCSSHQNPRAFKASRRNKTRGANIARRVLGRGTWNLVKTRGSTKKTRYILKRRGDLGSRSERNARALRG
jgi:hypothetical protein